jgi:hypothetical protein
VDILKNYKFETELQKQIMILADNQNINFIIGEHHSFSKKRPRGGHMMLHRLAYKLAEKGHNVYIFASPVYPHENITVIPQEYWEDPDPNSNIAAWSYEQFFYPTHKTVSIYPCDYIGNPFGTVHNVRWLLDQIYPEAEETWHVDDVYFRCAWEHYSYPWENTKKLAPILSVVDYKFDDFYDEKLERKGFCYLPWKYTPENAKDIISEFDPFIIDRFQSDDGSFGGHTYLRKVFNEHEYMLTFDNKFFLTVAAGLCGCKTILLESPLSWDYPKKLSPTEYRLNNSLNMFGVAYGIDDIKWADQTIGLVKDYQKEHEKFSEQTVDRFIEFWKDRLKM